LGFVHVSNLYDSVIDRTENYKQINDISILKRKVNKNVSFCHDGSSVCSIVTECQTTTTYIFIKIFTWTFQNLLSGIDLKYRR
jgi:hypothetical protein